MPNHVQTNVTVTGEDKEVKRFVELVMSKEKSPYGEDMVDYFDFDKVIPMPESLNITSGSTTSNAIALIQAEQGDFAEIDKISDYPWIQEKKPASSTLSLREFTIKEVKKNIDEKAMKEGQMALDNTEKYGCATWYDWKCQYWGTKWGAYDCHINEEADGLFTMAYNTAWSPATPIFDKLSEMFPALHFNMSFIDEGMGFAGRQEWMNGDFIEDMYEGNDMYQFANDEFGGTYIKCECGEWFNSDWYEEGQDENKCEDCQLTEEDEKEQTLIDEKNGLYPDKEDISN